MAQTASIFAITLRPQSRLLGVNGITASGADGITISGADSFVLTGVAALMAALNDAEPSTGIAGVDPELAVLLNTLTDDSNVSRGNRLSPTAYGRGHCRTCRASEFWVARVTGCCR